MVYVVGRLQRSNFRKLPYGQAYWLATDTSVNPTIKNGRRTTVKGVAGSTGIPTTNTVSNIKVDVVLVPHQHFRPAR